MKKLSKQIKCHWCGQHLKLIDKSQTGILELECDGVHCNITINSNDKTIRTYILYHDIEDTRYKIVGDRINNTTKMYSRKGTMGYKLVMTLMYLPVGLKEGIIQLHSVYDRLKKLIIFS